MAKVMTERQREPAEVAAMRAQKPAKKATPPKHIVALAAGPKDTPIALLFWKLRNELPGLSITITEHDIKGYRDSMEYQEQEAQLIIEAHRVHKDKPGVLVIRIADKRTGDMIRISENSEEALEASEQAKKLRRMKEQIPNMVANVRSEMSQGITSDDSIRTLCEAATALARI